MATDLTVKPPSIIVAFGERYGMDSNKVMSIVQDTVFKAAKIEDKLSAEEVAAALIVCNQYELNPFLKEIYAFRSKGKLLVTVSVDGWATIINRQAALDGIEFEEKFDDKDRIYSVTCRMWRKDRKMPTVVTEYTHECKRDSIPWNTMPIRMTRNRALIQCARVAFSISGIVDEDEAATIEGHPGPVIEQGAWSEDQSREATNTIVELGWARSRCEAFTKQYAERPTEGLAYLRKEVEKLKRVTPKKQTQETPPPAEVVQDPAPTISAAQETTQEEKPAVSEPEW